VAAVTAGATHHRSGRLVCPIGGSAEVVTTAADRSFRAEADPTPPVRRFL